MKRVGPAGEIAGIGGDQMASRRQQLFQLAHRRAEVERALVIRHRALRLAQRAQFLGPAGPVGFAPAPAPRRHAANALRSETMPSAGRNTRPISLPSGCTWMIGTLPAMSSSV